MTEPLFSSVTPAGYSIDYFEKPWGRGSRRWYEIDGERCKSVTEILGFIDDGKAGGMAYAAGRIWLAGVVRVLREIDADYLLKNLPDAEAWESDLKARKLLHTDVWGAKASTGTDVHTILEELCEGKVPSLRNVPEDQQGYAKALCEFWADHDPHVLHSEILLGSREHKYAGRCDLVYGNDRVTALDAKTSKSFRPSYALQLRGYADAYEEAGYGQIDRTEVLWLKPDGYEVIETKATSTQWQAILSAYRAFDEVKQEAKAA